MSEDSYGNMSAMELKGGSDRPVFFVVFGNQRTGSTLVASRLNSHPHIICHEEILLPSVDSSPSLTEWLKERRRPQLLRSVPVVKTAFLTSVFGGRVPANTGAIGAKIMYDQMSLWPRLGYVMPPVERVLRDPALHTWLMENGVVIVHTLRRNHLKTVVSLARARQTGHFHSREAAAASDTRIVLPLRGLMARLRRIESAERMANDAIRGLRVIEVWYEDYIGGEAADVEKRLCAALGQSVPAGGLTSPLSKVSSDDLRDILANYEQVKDYLTDTRYEAFLA